MSEQVSSFLSTEIGAMKYLFYITSWHNFQTTVAELLDKNWEKFGEALGQEGKIVKPYDSASGLVFQEILSKPWDSKIVERMTTEQDPFMLVTKVDFESFDPRQHEWTIVWFSEFRDSPDHIPYALQTMANISRESDDLISHLKQQFARKEASEFAEIFEIKPGLFGCSIDLKEAAKKFFNLDASGSSV